MSAFNAIDLSLLPVPNIIEALSFETIFAEILADLQARDGVFNALVESDPAYKVLEVAAYRELLIRQRINDAEKAVMLAYATGSDLDNLGAIFNVARLVMTPANPNTIPPTTAVMEVDANFRTRIQFAMEGLSNAGSCGAYIFHALSASPLVRDVAIDHVKFHIHAGKVVIDDGIFLTAPEPGMVAVTVLSTVGNGIADITLLNTVQNAVNAENVRPLTDRVITRSAEIVSYQIVATLHFYEGPSSATVLTAAQNAIQNYISATHKIGYDVTRSGIFAALHQAGVQNVELWSPTTDIVIKNHQVSFCTAVNLANGGTAL